MKDLTFNGINQYINVPNNAVLNPTGNKITLLARVHPTSTKQQIIIHKWADGAQYTLEIYGGKATFVIVTNEGNHVLSSDNTISTVIETSILATYNGDEMYLYEDTDSGYVKVGEMMAPGNLQSGSGPVIIGKRSENDAEYFEGKISEVFLYSTSATEVEIIHKFPAQRFKDNCMYGFKAANLVNLPNVPSVYGNVLGTYINYSGTRPQLNMAGNKYITVVDAPSLNPTDSITIVCDVKVTNGDNQIMVHKWGGSSSQYSLEIHDGKAAFVLKLGGAIVVLYSSASFPLNSWVRVVGTYDGSIMRIYENSVEMATLDASGNIRVGNGQLTIGKRSDSGATTGYINGDIGVVEMFDIALSHDQIEGSIGIPLLSYGFQFNNYDKIPVIPDMSGRNNNGTLYS